MEKYKDMKSVKDFVNQEVKNLNLVKGGRNGKQSVNKTDFMEENDNIWG